MCFAECGANVIGQIGHLRSLRLLAGSLLFPIPMRRKLSAFASVSCHRARPEPRGVFIPLVLDPLPLSAAPIHSTVFDRAAFCSPRSLVPSCASPGGTSQALALQRLAWLTEPQSHRACQDQPSIRGWPCSSTVSTPPSARPPWIVHPPATPRVPNHP